MKSLFVDQGPGGDPQLARAKHDRTGNLPLFPASSPINLRRSFAAERTARAIFVPYEAEQEAIHKIVALRAQGRPRGRLE